MSYCCNVSLELTARSIIIVGVTLSDYFNAYHTQINTGTALFLYLNPFTKALSLILYNYILDLSYHCMIQSLFEALVRYNLLQVRLSLVDEHLPLHSLAYLE